MKTTIKNLMLNLEEYNEDKEVIILTLEDNKKTATKNRVSDFQETDNEILIFTEKI